MLKVPSAFPGRPLTLCAPSCLSPRGGALLHVRSLFIRLSPVRSLVVYSVSPVCPLMQFQVRCLMHFFTFKQFHCKQLYVFVYGSRWVHFFVPRTFTAGFFFSRGFSYPLYPALSGWYLLYPSVCSPLIPRAFPSLSAPLFATPCIHPRVT